MKVIESTKVCSVVVFLNYSKGENYPLELDHNEGGSNAHSQTIIQDVIHQLNYKHQQLKNANRWLIKKTNSKKSVMKMIPTHSKKKIQPIVSFLKKYTQLSETFNLLISTYVAQTF